MTWVKIYEEQIERIKDFSPESQVTLLQNSLRACAEAFDRMEASTTEILATMGKK